MHATKACCHSVTGGVSEVTAVRVKSHLVLKVDFGACLDCGLHCTQGALFTRFQQSFVSHVDNLLNTSGDESFLASR